MKIDIYQLTWKWKIYPSATCAVNLVSSIDAVLAVDTVASIDVDVIITVGPLQCYYCCTILPAIILL